MDVKNKKTKETKPKVKKVTAPEDQIPQKLKRWFYGVGKEFKRITWIGKRSIFNDFCTIIVIVGILSLVYLAMDSVYILITK